MPTLTLLITLPVLVGLGIWQLQRHHWKEALLADYQRNIDAPLLDLGDGPVPPGSQFRLVRLSIDCPAAVPRERVGHDLAGATGFAKLVPCTTAGRPLWLDAGWSARPDATPLPAYRGPMEGRLLADGAGGFVLVGRTPLPPLAASAPPGIAAIPNNHLSYAFQWFSFAAVLAVIYALWLRRRLAPAGRAD